MSATASSRPFVLTGAGLGTFLIVVHATNDAFTSMLAALLPTLQVRFDLTETTLALLVATLSFSSSVLQPLFGALSDRLGRRLVAGAGVMLSSALLSLMGVVPTVWLLFAVLFVGGLGSAAFHPSGTSMARNAGRNKSLAVSLFSFGGTVGLAVGPAIILFVIANYGIERMPLLMIPGILLGILTFFVVPRQERAPKASRPKLFDLDLFLGPVGVLCLSGVLRSVPFVTFMNAVPLLLVTQYGVARDDVLIGITLGAFSFSAGLGGVIAGLLGRAFSRQAIITGTMLLSLAPLFAIFLVPPSSPLFLVVVILSGALVNAGLPHMIVSAQDLAPHAVSTASGMLMGFTWGTAGLIYIGIGRLQEIFGIMPAMTVSFLAMIPGAALAYVVLKRNDHRLSS